MKLLKGFAAMGLVLVAGTVLRAGQATLAWDPNTEPDLAGYNLYYSLQPFGSGGGWKTLGQIKADPNYLSKSAGSASTQLLVINLQAGQTYHFRLSAFDTAQNESGLNVNPLGQDTEVQTPIAGGQPVSSQTGMFSPGNADGINDDILFPAGTTAVKICDMSGRIVWEQSASVSASFLWNGKDQGGRPLRAGLYIAQIKNTDGSIHYQKIAVVK
jgi:hypothetical protein